MTYFLGYVLASLLFTAVYATLGLLDHVLRETR